MARAQGAKFKLGDRVIHKLGEPAGIIVTVIEPTTCARCRERGHGHVSEWSYDVRVSESKNGRHLGTLRDMIESELQAATTATKGA